jgi:hypothetical protein
MSIIFFFISNWPIWPQGEGEGEIRTSDLRFMRHGLQPIELPDLHVNHVSTDHSFISFIVNLTYEFSGNYKS